MKTEKKLNLKVFLKILYQLIIIICILFIALMIIQKITDSGKSLGGYRIFVVVSGSMSPKFNVGEVVVCKEIDVEKIKIGDSIVYRGDSGDIKNKIIMHDVVEIKNNEDGNIIFHARGIANNEDDPDVKETQVLGIVIFKSGLLSNLLLLAQNKYSSFFIIFLLVLNVYISFHTNRNKVKYLDSSEIEEDDDEYDEEDETEDIDEIDSNDNDLQDEIELKDNETDKEIDKKELEDDIVKDSEIKEEEKN